MVFTIPISSSKRIFPISVPGLYGSSREAMDMIWGFDICLAFSRVIEHALMIICQYVRVCDYLWRVIFVCQNNPGRNALDCKFSRGTLGGRGMQYLPLLLSGK